MNHTERLLHNDNNNNDSYKRTPNMAPHWVAYHRKTVEATRAATGFLRLDPPGT